MSVDEKFPDDRWPDVAGGRARIIDVAQRAGVSIATVDRVLNERAGVRPATAHKVRAAVRQLEYRGEGAQSEKSSVDSPALDFILPAGAGPSIEVNLQQAIERVGLLRRVKMRCRFFELFNPVALADKIREAASDRTAGIAFHGLEHPAVRDALDAVHQTIPMVAILSHVTNPLGIGYVGIDNRAAGRTAGYLMGRFLRGLEGKVTILAGSPLSRCHEEREMGFRAIIRDFPGLDVLDVLMGHDSPEENYQNTTDLLNQHPDLLGIYCVGSGNQGVIDALKAKHMAGQKTLIMHNLTAQSRQYLLEGWADAIIAADMGRVAALATDKLFSLIQNRDARFEAIPFDIVVRENLP